MIQTIATPAVGVPGSSLQTPVKKDRPRLFISNYTEVANAIDTDDEVLNYDGDPTIRGTGASIDQVTSAGDFIATTGDVTYAPITLRLIGTDEDPTINLCLLKSNEREGGAARAVNYNVMNFDESVHRAYANVLHCNPAPYDDQGAPGYDVTFQPFSVDRYVHTAA